MSMRSKMHEQPAVGQTARPGSLFPREPMQRADYSADYLAATLHPWAARAWSITGRQPVESWAFCFIMQPVMAGMLGVSDEHSRNASLAHICCASALKAQLEGDDSAATEP